MPPGWELNWKIEFMYQMENEIPFTRSGADGKLKLHEAVAMMADCCQFQEYQEGKFRNYLQENNIAVFLFSMQLDILRMPHFREKVKTAVKIYGCKSIYGLRQMFYLSGLRNIPTTPIIQCVCHSTMTGMMRLAVGVDAVR